MGRQRRLTFSDRDNDAFAYAVGGISQAKKLLRLKIRKETLRVSQPYAHLFRRM